jgi:hypothetical protein
MAELLDRRHGTMMRAPEPELEPSEPEIQLLRRTVPACLAHAFQARFVRHGGGPQQGC